MADFPDLVKVAAKEFPNECSATSQIWRAGDHIGLRLQAIDIMHRFFNEFDYKPPGPNVRGFLFFKHRQDFETPGEFLYIEHGSGEHVTVEVAFRKIGGATFAKFFARVDTKRDPLPKPNGHWEKGQGIPWKAALTRGEAVKDVHSGNIALKFGPLGLKVVLDTPAKEPLNGEGILFFEHSKDLSDTVDGKPLLALVTGDKIPFIPQGESVATALFLPFDPLPVGIAINVKTKWEHLDE